MKQISKNEQIFTIFIRPTEKILTDSSKLDYYRKEGNMNTIAIELFDYMNIMLVGHRMLRMLSKVKII